MSTQNQEPGWRMANGKHQGKLITRVPAQYLRWMVNEGHQDKHVAREELKRRGTIFPKIELSSHAVDRASLRLRKLWHETAVDENEGIYTWLGRMAQAAWEKGQEIDDPEAEHRDDRDIVKGHAGIKFVFHEGEEYPVVKTVMPLRGCPTQAHGECVPHGE